MSSKIIDIKGILNRMPHRYPFLLVDRVLDYELGKWIKALKNVTINEPYFQGHFPGEPVMPGVLQIEALAQAGGILACATHEDRDIIAFFMTVNNCKFRKMVVPGVQLILTSEITKVLRGNIIQVHGKGTVDGKVVSEGDFMFTIVDRADVK